MNISAVKSWHGYVSLKNNQMLLLFYNGATLWCCGKYKYLFHWQMHHWLRFRRQRFRSH